MRFGEEFAILRKAITAKTVQFVNKKSTEKGKQKLSKIIIIIIIWGFDIPPRSDRARPY